PPAQRIICVNCDASITVATPANALGCGHNICDICRNRVSGYQCFKCRMASSSTTSDEHFALTRQRTYLLQDRESAAIERYNSDWRITPTVSDHRYRTRSNPAPAVALALPERKKRRREDGPADADTGEPPNRRLRLGSDGSSSPVPRPAPESKKDLFETK